MKIFFMAISLFIFSISTIFSDIKDEPVLLLSYPRSGNTWTRYCIEYITKRPTGEIPYLFPIDLNSNHMNSPINNSFDLGVDYKKFPVIKLHSYNSLGSKIDFKYLVIIVRDYKECIMRQHSSYNLAIADLEFPHNWYIDALKIYDNWDKDKRLLLYYEDLMNDPFYVYNQIANFFGEGKETIENFINEEAEHKANGIWLYSRYEMFSASKGTDIHFHAKKLTPEQIYELDSLCKNLYPEIFDLYLRRYESK